MESVKLVGETRKDIGKRASSLLRRSNNVPCVIYGGKENINFFAPQSAFKKAVYTDKFHKVAIEIGGNTIETIVQDIQFHPLTDQITHIDFLQLVPGNKVTVEIPIRVHGFSKGVQAGGKMMIATKKVKIKALVENLVDHVDVDITNLDMGKSIKVKELNLPNVDILTPGNIPVVNITVPRVAKVDATAAAKK